MQTNNLSLIKFTAAHFEAIRNNDDVHLGRIMGVNVLSNWTHFPEAMPFFEHIILENPNNEWISYFIVFKADNALIGTCGFKGGPSDAGTVEIGYEIHDDYQLRGLASEAASALLDFAFARASVTAVIAHTIAQDNPSTSVLKKLGFSFVQTIEDPDDGLVYQWAIKKP